jgi:hypothetical protein
MTNEPLSALEAEIAQQNIARDEVSENLRALGDVELHVPAKFFEELDSTTGPAETAPTEVINGLRG